MGLLDAATVIRGDGQWSSGYDQEESGCGLVVRVAEVCAPTFQAVIGDLTGEPNLLQVNAFSIDAALARSVRCALDQDLRRTSDTLKEGEEHAIAHVFENGIVPGWTSPHLNHVDVETVEVQKDDTTRDRIGKVLERYYAKSTMKPLVHVGLGTLLDLITGSGTNYLDLLDVETVYSPGYSHDLLALTGPVKVLIGSAETVQVYDTSLNRTEIQATEVAAVDFDVCHAVRVDVSIWKGNP